MNNSIAKKQILSKETKMDDDLTELYKVFSKPNKKVHFNRRKLKEYLGTSENQGSNFQAFVKERDKMNRLLDSPIKETFKKEVHQNVIEATEELRVKTKERQKPHINLSIDLSKLQNRSPTIGRSGRSTLSSCKYDQVYRRTMCSLFTIKTQSTKNSKRTNRSFFCSSVTPEISIKNGERKHERVPSVGEYNVRYPEKKPYFAIIFDTGKDGEVKHKVNNDKPICKRYNVRVKRRIGTVTNHKKHSSLVNFEKQVGRPCKKEVKGGGELDNENEVVLPPIRIPGFKQLEKYLVSGKTVCEEQIDRAYELEDMVKTSMKKVHRCVKKIQDIRYNLYK